MKDQSKTRAQLIEELLALRQRISGLEALATDRNDFEQALRESERKLLTLMSNLPGVAYRCLNDGNWTMEFLSDRCFELTGHKPSDLIGNRSLSHKDLIYTDDRNRVWNEVQAAVRARKPFRLVYRISTSTGETKWVSEQGIGVFDPEGDVMALEGFIADISEQRAAEERLKHLNLVLRALRNVNQLVGREKDVDKLISGACENLVETRGYHNAWIALLDGSAGEMKTAEAGLDEAFLPMLEQLKYGGPPDCGQIALKQSGVVVFNDPHASCTDCPLSRMYEGRAAMVARLEHHDKVFGILTVSMPSELAYDQEEQTLFQEIASDIALALHDIELEEHHRQSEEALRKSEKLAAVGKLAAGVAHSVRNPLTSVKMRLFSMERSVDLSDTQKEDFEVISEEIRNIDNIIRNFLAFSRPSKLKMQKASPSTVVDTTLRLLSQRLDSYGVEVTVNRERRLAEISIDSEQLEEVLVNLIINSCEAMGSGGQIAIHERLETPNSLGQKVTIMVSDNGPGVPESVQDKLFEPFFSTKDEGTGLGLSIAARIVEEHGGSLRFDPTKGGGATFIITLPIKEEPSWATS